MKKLVAVLLLCVTQVAFAACDNLYPKNKPLNVPGTTELCSSFFVSRYNVEKRAVIITSALVSYKQPKLARVDSFKADIRIPKKYRVSPHEYTNSGYDKGHMTPAGDAVSPEQMEETFLMTNMTPQDPTLNRVMWRELEYMVRGRIMRDGADTHIITGAVYSETPATVGKKQIPIPVGYVKIAYFKSGPAAFYADNKPDTGIHNISVQEAEKILGLSSLK